MKKTLVFTVLACLAGFALWYFLVRPKKQLKRPLGPNQSDDSKPTGFEPEVSVNGPQLST